MVEAGYGTFESVAAMAPVTRRAAFYFNAQRQGGTVNWQSGEVVWPPRT